MPHAPAKVLIPLPSRDFDPSEAAVSWLILTHRGHCVEFATRDGQPARADDLMLTGKGLDPWGWIPLLNNLRLIGLILRANGDARRAYADMERDPAYRTPRRWSGVRAQDYDALLLPGGHRARGMRDYLESEILQQAVVAFFDARKPVAAICHGVLLAARSIDPKTGRSVLHGHKTTALTWQLERTAASLGRVVRFWDPAYYRTYREKPDEPSGYMSVQQEVTRALASPSDFQDVPAGVPDYRKKTSGTSRDRPDDPSPAFVVRDGNYVSARWPGDVHTFAATFAQVIEASTL